MVGRGVGAVSRRRLIAGLLLVPPALAGCSLGSSTTDAAPDPLIELADAARADAALAAAAVAADPELAERVTPLRTARTEHATALDAEVARLDPARATATATAAPALPAPAGTVTLNALRDAVKASGQAAATAALTLPAARVGLVASVAACCATYGAVLA
jgi:hypothetical protein